MKTGWHKPAQEKGTQDIDEQGAMGKIGTNQSINPTRKQIPKNCAYRAAYSNID
jgi:hypothetical protein